MAFAAIHAGLENVRTNMKSIKNQDVIKEIAQKMATIEQSLVELKKL
jgi:formiminotetrahydrofolate cyclodeaminase